MNINKTATIIAACLLFFVFTIMLLYPYIRYEKATVAKMDIRYDRFNGVIYAKNSHERNSQWMPTEFKTMEEAKQYLAKKELEENLEEARKELNRKQKKSNDLNERTRYY
jgi:hypothetical protein